jgi:tetrahydromethanopterin S-methyltransferase subunit F
MEERGGLLGACRSARSYISTHRTLLSGLIIVGVAGIAIGMIWLFIYIIDDMMIYRPRVF